MDNTEQLKTEELKAALSKAIKNAPLQYMTQGMVNDSSTIGGDYTNGFSYGGYRAYDNGSFVTQNPDPTDPAFMSIIHSMKAEIDKLHYEIRDLRERILTHQAFMEMATPIIERERQLSSAREFIYSDMGQATTVSPSF